MTMAVAVRDEERGLQASPANVERAMQRPDRQQALRALLGDKVPVERFEQVVLQAIYRNPDIQTATLASLLDSVRVAATIGLEPTGILGEGYILKYGSNAQFEAGYRGLLKLARRSGQVDGIDAQIVYEHDSFDVRLGSEPVIEHRPLLDGDRGGYRGAYAYARLSTGELIVEWMRDADIQAVRKVSRNGTGSNSPWVNHFGEMARKTVLKRLMKRLPLGTDAEMALRVEAEAEQDAAAPVRRPSGVTRIHERLGITEPESVRPTEPQPLAGTSAAVSRPNAASDGAATAAAAPGTPSPGVASGPAPDEAEAPAEVARCDGFDVQLGRCVRETGHTANHKTKDGESWK